MLSGVLATAAIVPALFWLWPALGQRQALSFRDQGDFFYPLKLYTADRLRAGQIPLWNPFSGTGEPWLANLQSGVFYPPGLFFLLPAPALAAGLFLFAHFCVAAWGMRRFLREESVSESGALLGTVLYCSGGLAASLSAYWNHFGAWAYLPGIVALARSGLPSRGSRAGLALLVGLQAMAGSPELTGATLAVAALFALSPRPRPEDQWVTATPRRSLGRLAIAALLGLALAGWALVPMGELAWHSDRRTSLTAPDRESGVAGPPALSSALGLSTSSATSYVSSLYVGPLALFAAAAAFSEGERRKLLRALALVGLAGILIASAGPPGSWLRALPPFDRIRYPSKALVATIFALSALAGLGADALRFAPEPGRRRRALSIAGALAALALYGVSPSPLAGRLLGSAGVVAMLALGLGAGRRRGGSVLQAAAALALTGSLALIGQSLFSFVPEAEIRREPEELASLRHLIGRVLTPPMQDLAVRAIEKGRFGPATIRSQRESLLGYTNLLFGISTVRTAAALATRGAHAIADTVDRADDPLHAAGPASARVVWTPYRPVRLPSLKIGDYYRGPIAPYRPRLSFVRAFRIEPDPDRAWRRAAGGEIDLAREVFLDRAPRMNLVSDSSRQLLIARLAEDLPERVVADVTSNSAGVLVLTDLAYPGWSAEADGRPAELRTADGYFRAVPLSAGSHRVVFRYRPISVVVGAGVSVIALAILLLRLSTGARDDPRGLF